MVLDLPGELAGHLATAMRMHRDWAGRTGIRIPAGFVELEEVLTSRARRGQSGTALADLWEVRQATEVTPRLLTFRDVAAALACSERQVKRLTADGELPCVRLSAGTVRVRVSDLDFYVASLLPAREAV